ncbi:MAG: CooT family nickel-binding protein [Clostridiales Family XIII bacterium]|jgi:predicted RNA-binding protein|nr:CooT family nickel-binding protein [Clostridiales Family XIII bacterium]
MCLSTVYKAGDDAPLAEYVTRVKVKGEEITLTDITGNEVACRGGISSIDLVKNVITIADACLFSA